MPASAVPQIIPPWILHRCHRHGLPGQWSSCGYLLVLQTGAPQSWRYHELSTSSNQAKQAYCSWLLSQRGREDVGLLMMDFLKYLLFLEKSSDGSGKMCYPGSSDAPLRVETIELCVAEMTFISYKSVPVRCSTL